MSQMRYETFFREFGAVRRMSAIKAEAALATVNAPFLAAHKPDTERWLLFLPDRAGCTGRRESVVK
ncbi:hypothetical protein TH3_18090 [Thalassospira xiamenensis M-5 = DSM 17429]|uniref:Uncharacterized protein n=1 Tax=Thalassospira xiamenensis M-5 = DSM 17429 TaxID=1123366 RepID=A0AB72UHQ2_9PROT|nr:hypothetical protein TH3_18090 [Thalassospira xiamenensis M-5 = DSM 17429]